MAVIRKGRRQVQGKAVVFRHMEQDPRHQAAESTRAYSGH
jgi:hypothetical protein